MDVRNAQHEWNATYRMALDAFKRAHEGAEINGHPDAASGCEYAHFQLEKVVEYIIRMQAVINPLWAVQLAQEEPKKKKDKKDRREQTVSDAWPASDETRVG